MGLGLKQMILGVPACRVVQRELLGASLRSVAGRQASRSGRIRLVKGVL